jgi:hypothetical protein
MLNAIWAKIVELNEKIAVEIVDFMQSMACVYIFLIWALIPTFFKETESFVFYVSGGIIQLVALPLIMVGQHLQGRKAERRAKQDHENLKNIMMMVKQDSDIDVVRRIDALDEKLSHLLDKTELHVDEEKN